MKVKYDPGFFRFYKKASVRIKNSFDSKLRIFIRDPFDLELRNHRLKREWEGYRSIDITADWRAIYKEIKIGEQAFAYFVALGTHKELYSST